MAPNLLLVLIIVTVLIAALLSWWLEWNFLPLRQDQKWMLCALLLLAALNSFRAYYICGVVAWEPGVDSWLAGLLTLAVGGLALWLAQIMK